MANNIVPPNQDQQVKKVKRLLEGWRVALLPLKSMLLWEQQWHPCAIFGTMSFLFLLIWIMNLNTLATFAIIGLFLNFVDFIVPVVCNSIYGQGTWTGQDEKMFEDICMNIVACYNKALFNIRTFYSMRENSPCLYYVISISTLLSLAWAASSINNIFLFYILSTVMLLWPGIKHRGTFDALFSMVNIKFKVPFLKSE